MQNKLIKYTANHWDDWIQMQENSSSNLLDLTEGNPYKVFSFLKKNHPLLSAYLPDPRGNQSLRKKIVQTYKKKGYVIDKDNVLITTGTSESLSYILKTICNPTDEVLIPAPGYPLFEFLLDQEEVNYKYYTYQETIENQIIRWSIDLKNVENQISSKTKALILVNPSNPLGILLSENEKKQLESLLSLHGILLIVDEVFLDYTLIQGKGEKNRENIFQLNYFLLNGASKSYGHPGLKIGWILIIGEDEFKKSVNPILELISDTYLNVSTPSQLLFRKRLKGTNKNKEKILKRIQKNYKFIKEITKNSRYLKPIEIEYGWYLPLKINLGISEEILLKDLMQEKSLKVYIGSLFHFHEKKYMIISLIVKRRTLKKAFKKINKYFLDFS